MLDAVDAELDAGGELDADWLGVLLGLEDELDDVEGEDDGDVELDDDGEPLGEGEPVLAAGSG